MIKDPVRPNRFGSRQMTEEEVRDFLTRVRYGVLSYAGSDGWPDARIFDIGHYQGNYYFHSHKTQGEKKLTYSSRQKAPLKV